MLNADMLVVLQEREAALCGTGACDPPCSVAAFWPRSEETSVDIIHKLTLYIPQRCFDSCAPATSNSSMVMETSAGVHKLMLCRNIVS